MDQSPIFGHSSSPVGAEVSAPHAGATPVHPGNGSAVPGVGVDASSRHLQPVMRFPREDGGRSLAAMAQRDLDAALQLLTERAQYITGASGAAIALRDGGQKHLLCRASVGSNAPALGALLSTDAGLSGESVRGRLPLRCDDAERDLRVNRDGCRELGIASVAVVPIVSEDQVLGVFELFSGKANAFDERDVSALQRLGEMVETAVKLAQSVTGSLPEGARQDAPADAVVTPREEVVEREVVEKAIAEVAVAEVAATVVAKALPPTAPVEASPIDFPAKESVPAKPLFWTAAASAAAAPPQPPSSHVPLVLRDLHKCQACGFPVSEGRALCVECEEKEWRGQLRAPSPPAKPNPAGAVPRQSISSRSGSTIAVLAVAPISAGVGKEERTAPAPESAVEVPSGHTGQFLADLPHSIDTAAATSPSPVKKPSPPPTSAPTPQESSHSTALVSSENSPALSFLGGGVLSSESWFSANKYILGTVLMVVIVIAVIALVR